MNSFPYYDKYDKYYVGLNAMIETKNEQNKHCVCMMRECSLLYETNPSRLFPMFDVSSCVDEDSSTLSFLGPKPCDKPF